MNLQWQQPCKPKHDIETSTARPYFPNVIAFPTKHEAFMTVMLHGILFLKDTMNSMSKGDQQTSRVELVLGDWGHVPPQIPSAPTCPHENNSDSAPKKKEKKNKRKRKRTKLYPE